MPNRSNRKLKKISRFSNERRRARNGFLFVLPWTLGMIGFFLIPMITSILYTFSTLSVKTGRMRFVGWEHYLYAFQKDATFITLLPSSLGDMLRSVPLICIFSLFVAIILNQNFRGRTLARAVFFMPVIVATGLVIRIMNGDIFSQSIFSGEKMSSMFTANAIEQILLQMKININVITKFVEIISDIFNLSWRSGIQILIFLAGLQTIPSSLREVSSIEGATAWEHFWKVTFPLISPIMLLNVVYTVISSFTDASNPVMKMIFDYAENLEFSYSATLAWIYFLIVFIITGIVFLIINRRVFYMAD